MKATTAVDGVTDVRLDAAGDVAIRSDATKSADFSKMNPMWKQFSVAPEQVSAVGH